MISVQNHLQLLNGNKIFLIAILIFSIGCGTSKKVSKEKKREVVKETKKKKTTTPAVDTIAFDETFDKDSPPITNDIPTDKSIPSSEMLSLYNVAFFIPLNASQYLSNQGNDISYIEYYAGMKLAGEQLSNNGSQIVIDVIDTEVSKGLPNNKQYDLIIAPSDKNIVNALINYGKENKTLVISPWYSNSKVTEDNPYYLQLRPNLKEHFSKIALHAMDNFAEKEVALVGLNDKKYNSWFNYFQEIGKAKSNKKELPFIEHYVTKDSLANGEWIFGELIENGVKAFIVPNYSFRDEGHVYSVLRRLNAEKGLNTIYVYGMPLMIESDKINFDYYNNLNIKIAISEFVETEAYDVQSFKNRYFHHYGNLPGKDAYEGHDLMMLIGESLSQYGDQFPQKMAGQVKNYLQTTFDIQSVNIDDNNLEAKDKIDFYENKHLNIIEFVDGKFRKSK